MKPFVSQIDVKRRSNYHSFIWKNSLAFPGPKNDLSQAFQILQDLILLMDTQNRDKGQILTDPAQSYGGLIQRC